MNYSEKLAKRLKEKGLKKTWLATNLRLHYESFWYKMKDNDFTKEEKEKIEILIGKDCPEKTSVLKENNDARMLRQFAKQFKLT